MDTIILLFFIFGLIALNILMIMLHKRKKLNLIIAGIILLVLAPVLTFASGSLFLYFYDWSSGGSGEGAGYGGALIGFLTLFNGMIVLFTGIVIKIVKSMKQKQL